MPGERGLDRDLGSLSVANFADHHDVGVLSQDRAQAGGKGQPDLGIDLGLANTLHRIFDRVLDRQDITAAVVEQAHRGIERGGLARPGRPGDQDDAVGFGDRFLQQAVDRRGHAEHVERDAGIFLVENTQHDAFACSGRQRRHAHVEQLAPQRQADAAVLRHAALGDVEPRHDLHAADHHGRDVWRHTQRLAQHAVDPHSHDEASLIRLDMNVGHAVARGVRDDAVDQPDRGRIVGCIEQIVGGRQMVGKHVEFVAEAERACRHGGGLAVHCIGFRQQAVEFGGRDEADVERPRQVAAQFEQHLGIGPLAHRDREMRIGAGIEHHPETARERIGNGDVGDGC